MSYGDRLPTGRKGMPHNNLRRKPRPFPDSLLEAIREAPAHWSERVDVERVATIARRTGAIRVRITTCGDEPGPSRIASERPPDVPVRTRGPERGGLWRQAGGGVHRPPMPRALP